MISFPSQGYAKRLRTLFLTSGLIKDDVEFNFKSTSKRPEVESTTIVQSMEGSESITVAARRIFGRLDECQQVKTPVDYFSPYILFSVFCHERIYIFGQAYEDIVERLHGTGSPRAPAMANTSRDN